MLSVGSTPQFIWAETAAKCGGADSRVLQARPGADARRAREARGGQGRLEREHFRGGEEVHRAALHLTAIK